MCAEKMPILEQQCKLNACVTLFFENIFLRNIIKLFLGQGVVPK